MAKYRAEPGMEDRHGEMTGAIQFNMILSMLPVTVWCIFIGPWLFASVWTTAVTGVLLAVGLPLVFLRPSRYLWAIISHRMDRDIFK